MKMAEKSLMLTFQTNCESINSNCVEVVANQINEKITTNNDIISAAEIELDEEETNINKQEGEPDDALSENIDITQEDAVEEFLAGENKNEFNDELLLDNIDPENDGIDFKSDNVIDCSELEKHDFSECEEVGEDQKVDTDDFAVSDDAELFTDETLKTDTIGCLNKMQIMEDVREGCNVQPSSPGHAEQRNNNDDEKPDPVLSENGFDEDGSTPEKEIKDEIVEPEDDSKEDEKIVAEENGDAAVEKNDEMLKDTNNHLNEESYSNASSVEENHVSKRKIENQDTSSKRMRSEIQDNFSSRDKIFKEFIETSDCNNVDQIQSLSDQILAEIRTLNELAREKEREWNNIIHLKKMKEELLLRVQRRKQVMLLGSDKMDSNGDILLCETQTDGGGMNERLKSTPMMNNNQSILKANLMNPSKSLRMSNNMNAMLEKQILKSRNMIPRSQQQSNNNVEMNGSLDYRQGRQRPIIDVQSIIADYRQRHPETVPRRGRRIRNCQNDSHKNSNILNFSSLALGSGSQVQHNLQGLDVNSELGLLISAMDANRSEGSRPSSAESSTTPGNETSFKDMLVQFARLSQTERNELIQNAIKPPPPYPEVTVHPVPTVANNTSAAPTNNNSLLHGILTKSPSKSKFSPTLARLLTAPERANSNAATSTPTVTGNLIHPPNMSISEILSTSKSRNEITITPVSAQFEQSIKGRAVSQEEDEAEDSADRLVIDESNEPLDGRARGGDNSSDAGDDVPQCQGCNQKAAEFVCAGCGNQWYCSRDCQVSAWDEHSEVCSG